MRFLILLVVLEVSRSFSLLNMDPYDTSVFEKKFYGFKRHSNNPNYARLPKEELTPYRILTEEELNRMDNTLFNNVAHEPTVPTTVPTTLQPSPTTTTAACVGTERDLYDKCPSWSNRCHIQDVHLTCAYTCNNCSF